MAFGKRGVEKRREGRDQGTLVVEAHEGAGGHTRAHGSGLCACEAYGRPIVEEKCGATEGEGIVSGLLPSRPKISKKLTAGPGDGSAPAPRRHRMNGFRMDFT